jgi:predicted nuclease with TOPRIM domain
LVFLLFLCSHIYFCD